MHLGRLPGSTLMSFRCSCFLSRLRFSCSGSGHLSVTSPSRQLPSQWSQPGMAVFCRARIQITTPPAIAPVAHFDVRQHRTPHNKHHTMKKQIVGILTAAVLVFGASGCATHSRCATSEYKVVRDFAYQRLEAQLNDLSKQGWTVVSITASRESTDSTVPEVIALLKRPRQ